MPGTSPRHGGRSGLPSPDSVSVSLRLDSIGAADITAGRRLAHAILLIDPDKITNAHAEITEGITRNVWARLYCCRVCRGDLSLLMLGH